MNIRNILIENVRNVLSEAGGTVDQLYSKAKKQNLGGFKWFNYFENYYDVLQEIDPLFNGNKITSFSKWIGENYPDSYSEEVKKALNKFVTARQRKLIDSYGLSSNIDDYDAEGLVYYINKITDQDLMMGNAFRGEYDIIGETPNWVIIRPLSFDASKYFGQRTKWCTTDRDNDYFYNKYNFDVGGSGIYINIPKDKNGRPDLTSNRKFQCNVSENGDVTCCDVEDGYMTFPNANGCRFDEKVPKELREFYLNNEYFKRFKTDDYEEESDEGTPMFGTEEYYDKYNKKEFDLLEQLKQTFGNRAKYHLDKSSHYGYIVVMELEPFTFYVTCYNTDSRVDYEYHIDENTSFKSNFHETKDALKFIKKMRREEIEMRKTIPILLELGFEEEDTTVSQYSYSKKYRLKTQDGVISVEFCIGEEFNVSVFAYSMYRAKDISLKILPHQVLSFVYPTLDVINVRYSKNAPNERLLRQQLNVNNAHSITEYKVLKLFGDLYRRYKSSIYGYRNIGDYYFILYNKTGGFFFCIEKDSAMGVWKAGFDFRTDVSNPDIDVVIAEIRNRMNNKGIKS